MDHDFKFIIPAPGNIQKSDFCNFLICWKYWKWDVPGCRISWQCGRRAGGSFGQVFLAWIMFGTLFLEFPVTLEHIDKSDFCAFTYLS